jgi:hypothetical protein
VSDDQHTGDDNVRTLPVNVDLDLDAFERPATEVIPPYTVRLGGRTISMTNPDEIDWQDLLDIRDPVQFLRYSCSREDFQFILSFKLPGYKMAKLMEAYQTHFKIEEKLDNAARADRLRQR